MSFAPSRAEDLCPSDEQQRHKGLITSRRATPNRSISLIPTTPILPAIRTSIPPVPMRTIKARPKQWVQGLLVLDPEVELMASPDPKPDRQDPNVEEPGDTGSADIVGRTGEQMPRQSHDGLETEDRERVREDDVDAADEGQP
jgi:hypothetical protein